MMAMRRIALFSAAALFGAAALAQDGDPVSALKGHNTDAPVDVAAERLEVQDRADRAIFSGNVKVRQAELTLDAQRVTVAYSSGGGVQIDRIEAAGGVLVKSPSETASGSFGIYDTNAKLITLIGDVQLQRGANRVSGARLVIDLRSGRAVIDGGPPGTGRSGGRVTGHFTVPQRDRT